MFLTIYVFVLHSSAGGISAGGGGGASGGAGAGGGIVEVQYLYVNPEHQQRRGTLVAGQTKATLLPPHPPELSASKYKC